MDAPERARRITNFPRLPRARPQGRARPGLPHPRVATAALCLVGVLLFDAKVSAADDASSLQGWSEIAAQASDLEQGI